MKTNIIHWQPRRCRYCEAAITAVKRGLITGIVGGCTASILIWVIG